MLLINYVIETVLSDPIALWLIFLLALLFVGASFVWLLPTKEVKVKKGFDGGKAIDSNPTYKSQYVNRDVS